MTTGDKNFTAKEMEALVESHLSTSLDTPIRAEAFDISDETKIDLIEEKFRDIMLILGLDLTDDSLKGTPRRVAKMYVQEVFAGLNPKNKPEVKLFDNKYKYGNMLVEKDITLHSHCEHHFVPIIGKCHIAYIPKDKVVGLSKLNRIVKYYAKRPQVQERLNRQIAEALKEELQTPDVAVYIDADHMCVKTRGVEDTSSSTVTLELHGKFEQDSFRTDFLNTIR